MQEKALEDIKITNNNNKIRVLTYNIWFGKQNYEERVTEILRLMKESGADIICL